jgi:hypothetical protein
MDFAPASVLDFKFSTTQDGVPTTLAGTPVVSIYKDNSTTQTTTGVTLSVDFDGMTGCHNVRVDTADAFYASGSSFQVIVTTGTVGGMSIVGHVVDAFTLNRGAAYGVVASGTHGNAALKALIDAVDDLIDTELAAVKSDTAAILVDTGTTLDAAIAALPTAVENADALLNRDMSAVSDTEARSPLNALRFLRNKWAVAAGTLTVRKEDDATSAWTAAISSDASADPITGSDPA